MSARLQVRVDGLKTCSACKKDKLVAEFYCSKISSDGLNSRCKICHLEKSKISKEKWNARLGICCIDCGKTNITRTAERCRDCHIEWAVRENHPRWDGGRHVNADGYVEISGNVGHPRAHGTGNIVSEHTLVMEMMIGRFLLPCETAHHQNGNREDNRQENLELWSTSQPPGQRVSDKVKWAIEILKLYSPNILREEKCIF